MTLLISSSQKSLFSFWSTETAVKVSHSIFFEVAPDVTKCKSFLNTSSGSTRSIFVSWDGSMDNLPLKYIEYWLVQLNH
jgi:hypothetical protein